MSGWVLRDEDDPVRTLVGTLIDVHNAGGNVLAGDDSDTNIIVVPDAATAPLLFNRNGARNVVWDIECEVNVTEDGDGRSSFESWVSSMVGLEVTAKGVYVDDTGHDDKTEIHPMDLIIARVAGSALPDDWIGDLARQNALQVGVGLFAFRYAAASDDRGGTVFEFPPLAGQTRATSVTLPFPPARRAQPTHKSRFAAPAPATLLPTSTRRSPATSRPPSSSSRSRRPTTAALVSISPRSPSTGPHFGRST